jgi:cytochrome P450
MKKIVREAKNRAIILETLRMQSLFQMMQRYIKILRKV